MVQATLPVGQRPQRGDGEADAAVIVNYAGIFSFQPLAGIVEAEFHRQFNFNVLGAILIAQEAVKHFQVSGSAIINIGSTASANPEKNATIYAATKVAVGEVHKGFASVP